MARPKMDITERLRIPYSSHWDSHATQEATKAEAANEIERLRARVADIEAALDSEKEEFFRIAPSSRLNIIEPEDFCEACGGSGYQTYGSTATWRGGIGGAAMTTDVCDKCWGSGDKHRPWPTHRSAPDVENDRSKSR